MSGRKLKKEAYGQLGLTAICAAGLFSVLYLWKGLYPFGDGSILITDLYSQYAPLLYRFYDVVSGTKNLFMDFSVSGGANLYADTVNEILNPFNYVLFLFGRDEIYRGINVILWMYVTMAAVSVDYFLLKVWKGSRKWNVVFSLCYAFSGYMAYNYQIIKWMYFPVLFPLFLLAAIRMMKEKKGGLYALLLGYQLVLSVQLGFMTLLFMLFGSGFYFYLCVEKQDRRPLMCRLGLYTLAGILLSAAVLVPNAAILLSSSRAEENLSYFGVMKRHGLDDLFERLFQIAHPVLLALFVRQVFWRIRRKKRMQQAEVTGQRQLQPAGLRQLPRRIRFLAALNAFLWLTVLLQPANLLWHMGSYVCFPVRYAYMVLFCGICLIKDLQTEEEEQGEEVKVPEGLGVRGTFLGIPKNHMAGLWLSYAGVVILGIMALSLTMEWEERIVQAFASLAISVSCPTETGVVCLILALLFGAALCALAAGRKVGQLMPLAAVFCGICLFAMIFLPKDSALRQENDAAYIRMALQKAEGNEKSLLLSREKDDESLPLNAALINGQGSLSGYFPTASRRMKEAMEGLGYLAPWVSTRSVGGTAVSDSLLRRVLILDQKADELQLTAGASVLQRQEEMAAALDGKRSFIRFYGNSLLKEEGAIVWLQAEGEKILYLDAGVPGRELRVRVNGEDIPIPEADSEYSPHRILELGIFTGERAALEVTDRAGNGLPPENLEFAALDEISWKETLSYLSERENGSRELSDGQYEIKERQGQIAARFLAEEGQTLFLPFAALDGWKCVQNGKAVDIVPVWGGFMGITLRDGENEIFLSFTPPGLAAGIVLTFLGALGLCLGSLYTRTVGTSRTDTGQNNALRISGDSIRSGTEKVVAFFYRVLFAGGLAGIYVIPATGLFVYLICKVLGIGG